MHTLTVVQSANLKYSKTPTPPLALTVQNTFTQYTQVHYNGGTSISYRVRYNGIAQYIHTHIHTTPTHTVQLSSQLELSHFSLNLRTFSPLSASTAASLRTFSSTFALFLRYLLQQQPAFALSTQLSHLFSAICFNSSQPSHFLFAICFNSSQQTHLLHHRARFYRTQDSQPSSLLCSDFP